MINGCGWPCGSPVRLGTGVKNEDKIMSFYDLEYYGVCGQIIKLGRRVHLARKYRIDFLVLVYRNCLDRSLNNDALFPEGCGVSERTLDTCIEMGDADYVVAGVVEAAQEDPVLDQALRKQLGDRCYKMWQDIFKVQGGLQAELNF